MRLRFGDLTIRNLIISYTILYSIVPIVGRLTSNYLTTYFYMALVVFLVVLIIALDRPENLNEYFTFLLPVIVYSVFQLYTSRQDIVNWGYGVLLLLLPVILGYYFTQDKTRILASYRKLIVIAMIVTMITTIIGCIQNPNASRIMASLDSGAADASTYDMKNIGGYSFVYFAILLYPVLILAYKNKRIKLIPTLLIAALILATAVYSEYTTALLLFVATSLLFFMKRDLSVKGIVFVSVFAILFLLIFSNVIVSFLNWLGEIVGSEEIASRLSALSGGVEGLEASEDQRIALYRFSLNRFFENPLFGTIFNSNKSNGGHSFILDTLASFGIIGAALMFIMYRNIFTRFFLPFKDKPGYGYVVWTFIQTLILSLVNTGMWLDVLCLFAPIMFYWIYGIENALSKEDNKEESSGSESIEAEATAAN